MMTASPSKRALATQAENAFSSVKPAFRSSARWSASQNPALWRVVSYSGPGLPRPMIKRMGGWFIYPESTQEKPLPADLARQGLDWANRSEEHTSELQSLMRISYAVFCLKNNTHNIIQNMQSYIRKQNINNKIK